MLPKLYDNTKNATSVRDFKHLGTINHCTKCEVTEVRNGAYTLDLETTANDDCADLLLSQRIIGTKPNPFDTIQYFEIQKTERDLDGIIRVEAKHIKNFCFQYCSEGDLGGEGDVTIVSGTPKEIWDLLNEDYITTTVPFTFSSDVTTRANYYLGLDTPESLGNILGGKEGSFIDMWDGDFYWNNFSIMFLKSRGSTKPYQIRYGSNISSASQTETCANTYSHVLPYGKVSQGDHKINFFAPTIRISGNESITTKVYMLDCTTFLENYSVGTTGERYAEVRNAMTRYARSYAKRNSLGKLQIGISITLRAELDEMAQIGLCDTVTVILDNFGTKATAVITEVTYDSLRERWNKLVVGQATVTVADIILNKKRYVK